LAETVLGANASCGFHPISFLNFSSWLTSLKTLSLLVLDFASLWPIQFQTPRNSVLFSPLFSRDCPITLL
jgi:hypothetical protein